MVVGSVAGESAMVGGLDGSSRGWSQLVSISSLAMTISLDGGFMLIFALIVALALLVLVAGIVHARRTRAMLPDFCECSYPTVGLTTSEFCPECGLVRTDHALGLSGAGAERYPKKPVFRLFLAAPVVIGLVTLISVLLITDSFKKGMEAFWVLSPSLLPYLIHSIPVLVMGRRTPIGVLGISACVPALLSALIMGGAFAADWNEGPTRDDMMYPFTAYILATLFLALPFSLIAGTCLLLLVKPMMGKPKVVRETSAASKP